MNKTIVTHYMPYVINFDLPHYKPECPLMAEGRRW